MIDINQNGSARFETAQSQAAMGSGFLSTVAKAVLGMNPHCWTVVFFAKQLLFAWFVATPKASLKHHRRHLRPLKVKKIQRGFAIEYKSSRRKPASQLKSIWGNINLKSVTQKVQEETMPFLSMESEDRKPDRNVPLTGERCRTIASDLRETEMANQQDAMIVHVPAPTEPNLAKKEYQLRASKVTVEMASTQFPTEPATGKPKRGRKPKADQGASSIKRSIIKRAPKAVQKEVAANDEMADLLQLEDENLRLRKLLINKLRAENADLRARLNVD